MMAFLQTTVVQNPEFTYEKPVQAAQTSRCQNAALFQTCSMQAPHHEALTIDEGQRHKRDHWDRTAGPML